MSQIISTTFPVDPSAQFDYPVIGAPDVLPTSIPAHVDVAVFDGFHELVEGDKSQTLLNSLVKWSLNTSQVHQSAHIVFISDSTALLLFHSANWLSTCADVFAEEKLKSFAPLRGRVNTIVINDLPQDAAVEFVAQGMPPPSSEKSLSTSPGLAKKVIGVEDNEMRQSALSIVGIISQARTVRRHAPPRFLSPALADEADVESRPRLVGRRSADDGGGRCAGGCCQGDSLRHGRPWRSRL